MDTNPKTKSKTAPTGQFRDMTERVPNNPRKFSERMSAATAQTANAVEHLLFDSG